MNPSMRSGDWAACTAMVRCAWQSHANKGSNWLVYTLAGCALLLAGIGFGFDARVLKLAMTGSGIAVGLLALLGWVLLLSSLVLQNAGVGRLVPARGRRSVKVIVLAWIALVVIVTAPFVVAGMSATNVAGAVALALILVALSIVRPLFGGMVLGIGYATTFVDAYLMPLGADMILAARVLLGILAAIVAVRSLLNASSASSASSAGAPARSVGPAAVRQYAQAAYASALKRDAASGNRATLLLHCLGPAARTQPLLLPVAMLVLMLALSILAPSVVALYQAKPGMQMTLPSIVISVQLLYAYTIGTAVRKTAGEQGLLMLAVRRPPAEAINALLARTLMLNYSRSWLVWTVMLLAGSAAFGSGVGALLWLFALMLMTLAAGTLMLDDFACSARSSVIGPALIAVGAVLTLVAGFATGTNVTAGAIAAAAWTAVAVTSFALRRRAMLRAPVAFPAGRHG